MDARIEARVAEVLRRVAPGTELREALDSIISAHDGALIVIGDVEKVERLCDGGFRLGIPLAPQMVFELAKMDGAITLDEECTTILRANVHLVPDASLPTVETGIRHRTAQRVSRQTSALVVSVSKRRSIMNLYRAGRRITVEDVTVVLAKANQALQTLQRYRIRLDDVMTRLTVLEFEDAVTIADVVLAVQRSELVQRVAHEVGRYVDQLGTEGRLVAMQAEEVTANVSEEHGLLLRDYLVTTGSRQANAARLALSDLTQDRVLDDLVVATVLGFPNSADALEYHVRSRGHRVLRRIPSLPGAVINRLVDRFGSLVDLSNATEEQLDEVDGVGSRRARAIAEGLRRLRGSASI
jgi:diadenylate cyclase